MGYTFGYAAAAGGDEYDDSNVSLRPGLANLSEGACPRECWMLK